MSNVTVITGGAGGMGFATAKILGRDHHVIISDVNQERLDSAIDQLQQSGISCEAIACDITDNTSVDALMHQAASKGPIASVIHTAGISPQMAGPELILKVNALGTVNVTQAALDIATEGFALVNIASMAAYMFPSLLTPTRSYPLASTDPEKFIKKAAFFTRFIKNEIYRNGFAYGVSKNFVIWYSKKSAGAFGEKGARIVSISPGSFDTEMGRLEEKSGSAEMLDDAALKRFGRPEEMAELIAFCASDKASYLTGTDVLCDGGVIAGKGK